MRKVGVVTTPLSSGHAVRGIGAYVRHLLPELKRLAPGLGFEIFEIRDYLGFRNSNLDIIHYPFFDLFYHTLPIWRRTKTVVTIHDVIPLEFPDHYPPGFRGWFNLQLQKLALSGVEGVITDSRASQRAIIKYLGYPEARVKVVYLAADIKFRPIEDKRVLDRVRRKYSLPEKFVLYVGDINWNKNIPNLILVCEQINYSLVIVGKQAAEIKKMDLNHPELRHLWGVDWRKVRRLGFVPDDDLAAIYNLAKVYCQPSFAEGFGLPVLEAMACGTPVACSRTHSLPEIAGENATYFDPNDIGSMSKAVIKAMNHEPSTINLNRFSWEKTARRSLEVYARLI